MASSNPLKPWLQSGEVVILDGGLSTALEARGFGLDGDLWTGQVLLDDPSVIEAVHVDYLRAGADVVTTSSYQLSFDNLTAKGMSRETAAGVMLWSTEVALRAKDQFLNENVRERAPLVAASIGPYGAILADGSEYSGDYGLSLEELLAWHQPRFEFLARSGADLLACETIPSLVEVKALLQLISQNETPAWLSLSCRSEDTLADGTPLADVADLCREVPHLIAVGVNCLPPDWVQSALTSLGSLDVPLLAYPNGGGSYNPEQKTWHGGAKDWADLAKLWTASGALLIGGCCQSTTKDVDALCRGLRAS